jgi:hypothetical protein
MIACERYRFANSLRLLSLFRAFRVEPRRWVKPPIMDSATAWVGAVEKSS